MVKKPKTPMPVAKCDKPGCTNDAAYGFREYQDTSGLTTTGFIVLSSMNWCEKHDSLTRPEFANKNGRYIDLRNA